MAAPWWNINYPVRRKLKITPTANDNVLAGHPIYCFFDKDQLVTLKKARQDFNDIEILFYDEQQNPAVWQRIPRQITYDQTTDLITILFNAYQEINTINENYYVYMANQYLIGLSIRQEYQSSVYVLNVTPQNDLGLMFSRPGEDWNDGVSSKAGAKATLGFLGINARLVVEKGPDKGILELKLDSNESQLIDCYAPTASNEIVYEVENLSKQRHYIRITVTGNKSPSSLGNEIKIISMDYSKFIEGIDQGEEFYSLDGPITGIVGL